MTKKNKTFKVGDIVTHENGDMFYTYLIIKKYPNGIYDVKHLFFYNDRKFVPKGMVLYKTGMEQYIKLC